MGFPHGFLCFSPSKLQVSRCHSAASPTGGWKRNSWSQAGPLGRCDSMVLFEGDNEWLVAYYNIP